MLQNETQTWEKWMKSYLPIKAEDAILKVGNAYPHLQYETENAVSVKKTEDLSRYFKPGVFDKILFLQPSFELEGDLKQSIPYLRKGGLVAVCLQMPQQLEMNADRLEFKAMERKFERIGIGGLQIMAKKIGRQVFAMILGEKTAPSFYFYSPY